MMCKRVFKTKAFSRWAKKIIPDEILCLAAIEIEQGRFEAEIGLGICKKRIAIPGQGKRSSTRSLIAIRHESAIFYLVGRVKSDPGSDFSAKEVEAAKLVGKGLQVATLGKLEQLVLDSVLVEICNGNEGRDAK